MMSMVRETLMDQADTLPLVLGGHSFIPELGNEPETEFDTQLEIVSKLLDAGVRCFDTTYEPERVGLGRVLAELGRADRAEIIAWNFFRDEATGEYLVPPRAYREGDLDRMLEQLGVERLARLVVHPVGDDDEDRRQTNLAQAWQADGRVVALGTWAPGDEPGVRFGVDNPYAFMVAPRNVASDNEASFRASKALGWTTFATSPFNRGWLLDRLVQSAVQAFGDDPESIRARLADAMLRYSLFGPCVDRLIIGIRRPEWIAANLAAVGRGPLEEAELQWLTRLFAEVPDDG
jgi:aryl-alcohol dehydrogenase-like predicted oxidoreductase